MGQAFSGLSEREPQDTGESEGEEQMEQTPPDNLPRNLRSRRGDSRVRVAQSTPQHPYVLVPRVTGGTRTAQPSTDSQMTQAANVLRLLSSMRAANPGPTQNRRRPTRTLNIRNEGAFPPVPMAQLPTAQAPAGHPPPNSPWNLPENVPGGAHRAAAVPGLLPHDPENTNVLNQILSAAASAISLTTAEYQQRMDLASANGEPTQTARTAASFMDSFLEHLQHSTNAESPFPRLSLISESVNNEEDPSSTSIFRVFRMQQGDEANEPPAEADAEIPAATQASATPSLDDQVPMETDTPTGQPNPANTPNEMVPVLIIGIRSIPTRPAANQNESAAASPVVPEPQPNPRVIRTRSTTSRTRVRSPTPMPETEGEEPWQRAQRRSWVIYVIGSTYPATHPILSSAFGDNPTYEDLLMLSTFLGPARPPTTTQEVIDAQFQEVTYDELLPGASGISFLNGNRCQVCLSDYEHKDKLRILTCQHAYHTACIDKWLTQGSNNCPVCRRAGTSKDTKIDSQPEGGSGGEGHEGASVVSLVHDPPRS
ncbi:hypothetical protein DSO57_1033424 [Entomophthora muscae]|uniref:Uncharacterized protein n=1 Tax=Entomophthora muscae TaxID=34485 RepID=A0ACC2TB61_9FUNG|nr:hypothetical protein DSO57_1033424 [Entomophthora muscae]